MGTVESLTVSEKAEQVAGGMLCDVYYFPAGTSPST